MAESNRRAAVVFGLALTATLFQAVPACPSGPAASDYEISLKDLSKVKKELPAKKRATERRKRKKAAAVQPKDTAGAIVPRDDSGRVQPSSEIPLLPAAPEPQHPRPQESAKPSAENRPVAVEDKSALAEYPRISHSPYSYLVAGKRTVILAVISAAADIKSAYCRFRAEEKGAETLVPMMKVDGTQYTYRAILPGLAATSRLLRYRLVAVDTLGRETQSHEFTSAVQPSPVVPGWQLEDTPEATGGDTQVSGKPAENTPVQKQSR